MLRRVELLRGVRVMVVERLVVKVPLDGYCPGGLPSSAGGCIWSGRAYIAPSDKRSHKRAHHVKSVEEGIRTPRLFGHRCPHALRCTMKEDKGPREIAILGRRVAHPRA